MRPKTLKRIMSRPPAVRESSRRYDIKRGRRGADPPWAGSRPPGPCTRRPIAGTLSGQNVAGPTSPMTRRPLMVVRIFLVLFGVLLAATAQAQDKPRYGGELIFLVPSELPSYDGHREGTF